MEEDHNECPICKREAMTTKHHLIPIHKKGKDGPTVYLCTDCHDQIHALWNNNELRDNYSTIELLKESIEMRKFSKFISKQPYGRSHIVKKQSKSRKRKR